MPGLNVGFRIVQGALFFFFFPPFYSRLFKLFPFWEKFFFAVLLYLRNRKENGLC